MLPRLFGEVGQPIQCHMGIARGGKSKMASACKAMQLFFNCAQILSRKRRQSGPEFLTYRKHHPAVLIVYLFVKSNLGSLEDLELWCSPHRAQKKSVIDTFALFRTSDYSVGPSGQWYKFDYLWFTETTHYEEEKSSKSLFPLPFVACAFCIIHVSSVILICHACGRRAQV